MTARYRLRIAGPAAKALTEVLPEKVAAAACERITGLLLDNPRRVGKPLDPPMAPAWSARRGTYRILYRIDDTSLYRIDDTSRTVNVSAIRRRADAYHA